MLNFSISDIHNMQDDPERIPEIIIGYQEKAAADLEFMNNNDRLHTRMYDLLIWSYDLIFKELQYTESNASSEERDQLENLLVEINQELMRLSKEILDKSDLELAELTRHDNKAGEVLRSRINDLVVKYTAKTENLFKSIY